MKRRLLTQEQARLVSLAWQADVPNPVDRLALLSLAHRANDESRTRLRMLEMADDMHVSLAVAQGALARLMAAGHVTVAAAAERGSVAAIHPKPPTVGAAPQIEGAGQ